MSPLASLAPFPHLQNGLLNQELVIPSREAWRLSGSEVNTLKSGEGQPGKADIFLGLIQRSLGKIPNFLLETPKITLARVNDLAISVGATLRHYKNI